MGVSFRGHAELDFLDRRAHRDVLPHGLDQSVDVRPKRAQPVPTRDLAVAHDHVGEVELSQPIDRRRPVFRVAVSHEGRPADDGVAGDHGRAGR